MKRGLGVSLDLQIVPYDDDHVLTPEQIEEAKADLTSIFEEMEDMDLDVTGIACQIKEVKVIAIEEY